MKLHSVIYREELLCPLNTRWVAHSDPESSCTFIRPRNTPLHYAKANIGLSRAPVVHVYLRKMLPMADWHKVCKTLFRPTVNAVEWAAPSVNDDRLTEQVVGNIGGSGIDA